MKTSLKFSILSTAATVLILGSQAASAALTTYTTPMSGFTYNSDTVSAAFNTALGGSYNYVSFSGATNNDGSSYSPLVTFSTQTGTFGGSNTSQVNAANEIGPYGTWDGILSVDFNDNWVSTVGFGLVEFSSSLEFIRVYDDTDALIASFNNQTSDIFSLWGISATAGEHIGRLELDGNFFAIQDISFSAVNSSSVPEPASVALLVLGLAGLGFTRRQKK